MKELGRKHVLNHERTWKEHVLSQHTLENNRNDKQQSQGIHPQVQLRSVLGTSPTALLIQCCGQSQSLLSEFLPFVKHSDHISNSVNQLITLLYFQWIISIFLNCLYLLWFTLQKQNSSVNQYAL
jgi:hypothetical protein